MKEWSYTTGLLVGAALLLIAGLALTWTQVLEYNEGAQPAVVSAPAPEVRTGPEVEGAAAAVDTADADSVARAFLAAVAAGDLDEAEQYVLEDERASFREEMEAGAPTIPAEPELAIEQDDDTATVEVLDTDLTLELTYRDDRWWVAW